MLVDLRSVTLGKPLADVGSQALGRPLAVLTGGVGHMHLEIGLTKTLTSAVGESGDAVGRQPQQRGDFGRFLTFDLQMPEHELPPLGQRGERLGRGGVLKLVDGGIHERDAGVKGLQVITWGDFLLRTNPVDMQPSYGGQQVGPKRDVRAAALLKHPHHLDESLRNQVICLTRPGDLTGKIHRRPTVPFEQQAVRFGIAGAHRGDQFGIAGCGGFGQDLLAHSKDVTGTSSLSDASCRPQG